MAGGLAESSPASASPITGKIQRSCSTSHREVSAARIAIEPTASHFRFTESVPSACPTPKATSGATHWSSFK